jgi:hypothetical protein
MQLLDAGRFAQLVDERGRGRSSGNSAAPSSTSGASALSVSTSWSRAAWGGMRLVPTRLNDRTMRCRDKISTYLKNE